MNIVKKKNKDVKAGDLSRAIFQPGSVVVKVRIVEVSNKGKNFKARFLELIDKGTATPQFIRMIESRIERGTIEGINNTENFVEIYE